MTATAPFSQFRAGGEHKGRTATLKAVAYCTGQRTTDERNNRHFDFAKQGTGERILQAGIFLPCEFPACFDRQRFGTEAALQQAVWTSLARFEEKQRRQHAGRTGHGKPIISRHDVLLLDKRILLDENGKLRPAGIKHAYQVVTDFLRENYTRKGLVLSFAIHDQDGNGNFHVHIISSYRTLTADGWGERKRPFGKAAWATWAKQKQSSLFKIQTRKLEALAVIPKAERTAGKRETLTAWKIGRGFATTPDFQPLPKSASMNFKFVPVPKGSAIRAGRQPTFPAFISALPPARRQYAALPATINECDENRSQPNPENAGAGDSGGGSGGADSGEGVDFVLAGLQGAVASAEEKLKVAMQSGIGIAAAKAALATAKRLLAEHRSGGRGKGKVQRGAFRPRVQRHQQRENRHPER